MANSEILCWRTFQEIGIGNAREKSCDYLLMYTQSGKNDAINCAIEGARLI